MIKRVSAEQVRPLRALVLRDGRALSTAVFPKDEDPSTAHFAVIENEEILTVATVVAETHSKGRPNSYQLRGMATHPTCHGKGFGAQALQACLDYVRDLGGYELWCNARVTASGFYLKNGFEKVDDDAFDIPDVGPHYRMRKLIAPQS